MNRFIVLIVVVVTVVAGWSAAWFFGAGEIRRQITTQLMTSQNSPERLSCEQLGVTGFPFRYDISCTDARIVSGDITIAVPLIRATVLVYRPTHALIFATGPATYRDAFSGSSRQLRWQKLAASARSNGWALARISLEADNLELIDTLVGEKPVASASRVELHILDNPDEYDPESKLAQLNIYSRIDMGEVPEFDIQNANITLEGVVESLPDDIRLFSVRTIAQNWYSSGDGVQIISIKGNDDQSAFEFNGRLSATEQARLTGDFGLQSENIADRLSNFVDPVALQIMFGFRDESGSYNQSFSVRHGVVLAGNVPISTLPPLR